MPNSFFRFKQFLINQGDCAMKVTTDGCLFGAVLAATLDDKVNSILDIGTGTGLLSLMAAQQSNAVITAVELDEAAYYQAKANFAASPWAHRLQTLHIDAVNIDADKKYDLIISNLPFFENDLRSANKRKNAAKHDTTLTLDDLIDITAAHLSEEGTFAVLLPWHRVKASISRAESIGLFLSKQISVKQTPRHAHFRGILFFTTHRTTIEREDIIIKDEENNYTATLINLLNKYYLSI